MAADSDGSLTAVVICEGNLHDPEFPRKFRLILAKLKYILQQPKKSKKLKVNKVEPWNSVRVTLSIPKEAAAKLRQLASEGSSALRALGILSVQLEGDSVISLRLVGQDLILRTDNTTTGRVQEAGSSNTTLSDLSQILGSRIQQTTAGPSSCSTQSIPPTPSPSISEPIAGPSNRNIMPPAAVGVGGSSSIGLNIVSGPISNPVVMNGPTSAFDKPPIFKSPNTVCPMDGKLPVPPLANIAETHEYPFESMTQARVIQRRENTLAVVAALGAGGQSTTPVGGSPLPIGQTQQVTPPPLTIPVAGSPADSLTQQSSQQPIVKSPFMQPPPPPYPTASGTNPMKVVTHAVQHPLQQQPNAMTLSNNTNALSSPLLVNLLQNDGVNQVKVAPVASSVILQQSQVPSAPPIVSNLPNHVQNDGVLLLNNSTSSNDSSRISISPSIPVPSPSQTISNIPSNAVAASPAGVPPGVGVLSQNILGPPLQPTNVPGVGVRVQQQRFTIPQAAQPQGPVQQHLMPQHQIIHTGASGVQIQRFSGQPGQIIAGMGPIAGINQPTFRHPHQQAPQQITIQQTYTTPPMSPHPSLGNHPSQQQPPQQQALGNNFNHPRWPFKPMDSATKSSFQEFARYQLQYNLQQEMNSHSTIPATATAPPIVATVSDGPASVGTGSGRTATPATGEKSAISDTLGLGSYLDELSKTDLDSLLLPGLNDLDTALDLDGKNDLESLLDAKDLDLDLIDQDGPTTVLSSTVPGPARAVAIGMQPPTTSTAVPPSMILSQPPVSVMQQHKSSRLSNTPKKNTFSKQDQKASVTSSGKERQYLINPLTGELEPVPSDEESDTEDRVTDNMDVFNELNSEVSNSLYSDDDNSCSTAFSKTSDHSDTERSTNSEASGRSKYSKSKKEKRDANASSYSSKKSKPSIKNNLLREKLQQGIKDKISGKSKQPKEKVTTKAKLISIDGKDSPSEKIKLRLKLEKSEPVSPAYKVDISFVPSPKRAQTLVSSTSGSISNYSSSSQSSLSITPNSSPNFNTQQGSGHVSSASHNPSSHSPHGEELRVPPLHISLRGKNSIVIKNSKKDRKKSQSGGEEDESYLKKAQLKRNNNTFDEQNIVNRYVVTSNEHSHLANNMNNKTSSQGKPTTRPSPHDDYPVSNSFSKSVLENGEDADKVVLNKRNADAVVSQNGLIIPETKRRRMSQNLEQQQYQNSFLSDDKNNVDMHNHVQGPIGSTNVGTLPAHSSLSKNQKGPNNNNNSSNFINKIHKSSIKSGKPLVVVKQCKSPLNNPVKNPGKSPPVTAILDQSQTSQATMSTTLSANQLNSSSTSSSSPSSTTVTQAAASNRSSSPMTSKSQGDSPNVVTTTVAQSKTVPKPAITSCLLPQGSSDAMSKEKFKQKLLEFQTTEVKDSTDKGPVISEVANCNDDCVGGGSNNTSKPIASDPPSDSTDKAASPLSSTLVSEGQQDSSDIIGKSTATTILAPSSNASENLADELQDQTFQDAELKEQIPVADQQPKSSAHSQNPSALDVGINILNNGSGSSNARNSPGSQAQGEDSGIESMDALSEKSPHQSASPQQGDSQTHQMQTKRVVEIVHTKIEEKISLDVKDDPEDEITNIRDIEAALAKMEGINDHFLSECESPKLNGDHSMKEECLLENLTDEKIMLCAVKMEHADDLAAIMGGTNSGKSSPVLSPLAATKLECRDLNENKEISSNISLERQLIDECCKKSLKPNTKLEDEIDKSTRLPSPANAEEKTLEENVIQVASPSNEAEAKSATESLKSDSPSVKEEPVTATSSPLACDVISETNDNKSAVDIKEILTPITIEIPTHADSETPRVRTRASSKLESPLDAPKQSPQLDSPATANSLKSNLRLSAAAIDRLSPKVNAGKGAGTGGVMTSNKRKRQGSESSTQSCVSDDTPGRSNSSTSGSSAKRTRPNSVNSNSTIHGSHENVSTPSTGKSAASVTSKKTAGSGKNKKTPDESSDSDEPLIEVAGKVRGSKGPSSKSASSSDNSDNKVLRNHRASSQHSRTTTAHSTSSTTTTSNAVSHAATTQNSVTTKTIRGSSASHSNTSTAPIQSSGTVASTNSHNSSQNNTHCTRASSATGGTVVPTGVASTIANSASTNTFTATNASGQHSNQASASQAHHDDRPRRSVRASAAANKIIYARTGGITSAANHTNSGNASNDANNKTGSGNTKGASGNSATSNDGVEPRRKTRSAAGGEVVEGRRRRGSRDISSNDEDDEDEDEDDVYQYDNVDEMDEVYDDDIGSQTTQIDIDDLFNSTSQFEPDDMDEEQQVNVPNSTPDNNSPYVQHYFDRMSGQYVRRQFNYVGCTSKEIKMPDISAECVVDDDQLEPNSISDYDGTDDEPSPVMTSTDEDEDDSNDANDEDTRVVVRNMHIESSSHDFKGDNDDAEEDDRSSSDREQFSIPIVAIPISVMKR